MKTINFNFDNQNISNQIDIDYFIKRKNILIQIFCGKGKKALQQTSSQLMSILPHAICIGTTTDGEIHNNKIHTRETVVSISTFESTKIKSANVSNSDSFKNGELLANSLIEKNTKLLIIFTDGTTSNGEEFLKGVESVNKKIVVAGGMAGDNGEFIQTYISNGSLVLNQGAVGVSLSSNTLCVYNDYSFNWNSIGVGHKIDKANNNRVYSIDGITPIEFYSKYLGEYVADSLPATGIEFPLIIEKNNFQMARAVISKHDDGSLNFAGNLKTGDIVKLGFANAETIISHSNNVLKKFHKIPIDTFFLYSCMARRRFMQGLIHIEVKPFSKLAPVAGFFTYGEFYHHNNKNELLNQTLTAVALYEPTSHKNIIKYPKYKNASSKNSDYSNTIQALTHLIQQSTVDFEAQADTLSAEKQFSQELLANQKLFMRHAIHETNTPLSVIMSNIELHEMEYGKSVYLSNIEVAMKNIFSIYDDLSYLVKKDQISCQVHYLDLVDFIRSRIYFFEKVANQMESNFDFEVPPREMLIKFNDMKLQRIIDNTLTNAIKYTYENKPISVKLYRLDKKIKFSVSSHSKMIQHPKKVFEEYYREQKSKEGFGLGLNLVKRICDEENVNINLESNTSFTCFTYTFKGY